MTNTVCFFGLKTRKQVAKIIKKIKSREMKNSIPHALQLNKTPITIKK